MCGVEWDRSGMSGARGTSRIKGWRLGLILLCSSLFVGCAPMSLDVGYYWQSIGGHLAVMRAARPIDALIADPATDEKLRERLQLVQKIRSYASSELRLPDNGSYTRYSDLKRPFVLWNIFATPELSLKLLSWCFPFAGCVSYRGYYDQAEAEAYAAQLRADGYEVYVAGIPAYSTLGWFDDPVLSSFIHYNEGELARLVFHELAHQVLYLQGDSTFNESFATAVEEIGVRRWLQARGDRRQIEAYEVHVKRRSQFLDLLRKHRAALEKVYAGDGSDDEKRAGKQKVFEALQAEYQSLRVSWGGWPGYDRWFAQKPGNPHLASVATYTDAVPGFERLFEASGRDLPRFYDAARSLSQLPKAERDRQLGLVQKPQP